MNFTYDFTTSYHHTTTFVDAFRVILNYINKDILHHFMVSINYDRATI